MKENISKLVKDRGRMLNDSNKTLESLFNIIFSSKDNIAVEYISGFEIKKVTFKELESKIDNFAYSINKLYPSFKSEIIGIFFENSINWLISFWGILKSGNIPYLINLKQPLSLINNSFKLINCKYYVSNIKQNIEGEFIDISKLNLIKEEGFTYNFENELILSSSGTNLKSKLCIYSGEHIFNQLMCYKKIYKENKLFKKHYKGRLKLLAFIPLYHIFGFIATYLWFAIFSRTIVFLENLSSECIINTIQRCEVTHIFSVPLFFETVEKEVYKAIKNQPLKIRNKIKKGMKISALLQKINPYSGITLSKVLFKQINRSLFGDSVQIMISGGGFIKDSTIELFNLLGYPLVNGYGLTEVGIASFNNTVKFKDRIKNCIGLPLTGFEFIINDKNELLIKTNCGCEKIIEENNVISNFDIFNTHDLVNFIDGNYYILGRESDLIIESNGENINPNLIEQKLNIKNIIDFSILGLNISSSETLSIVVQISKLTLQKHIKEILEEIENYNKTVSFTYQIKKIFFTYDEIKPKNAIKVSRKYLRKLFEENKIQTFTPSLIEQNVVTNEDVNAEIISNIKNIIAKELGIENKDILDDSNIIFDLNANSIEYISIICEINKEYKIDLKFDTEACFYTPKELAKRVVSLL